MQVELADILKHTMSELTTEQDSENAIQNYHFVAVSAARSRDRIYKRAACELLIARLMDTGQYEQREELYSSCTEDGRTQRFNSYEDALANWKHTSMPAYLPIVRVAPAYPTSALNKGLEGHVDLKFTITTRGTTQDIRVVASTDRVFERAAKRAVTKFKYKPCYADGHTLATPEASTRVTFRVESPTKPRERLW